MSLNYPPRCSQGIQKYPKGVPKVSQRYTQGVSRYPQDIPKVSPRYPKDVLEMSQRYPRYSQDIPKYPQDIPKMSQGLHHYVFHISLVSFVQKTSIIGNIFETMVFESIFHCYDIISVKYVMMSYNSEIWI